MTAGDPILLPDQFNAAEYFIDRHLAEGRGEKVAIECADLRVTYRQLHEHVNRVGNGLRQLEVCIEERVFLLLLDTTDLISLDQLERYWPVGLIVFGIYMLYARLSPRAPESGQDRNAEVRR